MKRGTSIIPIAVAVVGIVMILILPIPPVMMDFLLIINISISLLIMLMSLNIKEPLEFSVFPTMLLVITLFRLSLNVATTKLILGNNGDAGNVVRTFGNFVIGSNLVVGIIIFLIIIAIQFIVITKGAERVAEVAARFTLDAMPGKQMAIDADLNSGLIDEQQAKERRIKIQREADFYGAMDGSSKFVKGDAIMGIVITVINIAGGLIIGLVSGNMPTDQVISVYTLATVGDGLVSQIPALLISTATGIIVTRAASDNNLGEDLGKQIANQPMLFYILALILALFTFIPGMPAITIIILAGVIGFLGYSLGRARKAKEDEELQAETATAEDVAQEMRKPEKVTSLLQVDLIGIELGYGIVPLVDTSQGGDLLERVVMIRRQCALDLGIIVPVIRLRDNIQLDSNEYSIKIKGIEVAKGEVMLDHFLALSTGDSAGELEGFETVEPTFGLPAMWIPASEREKAEVYGYSVIDPPSVIATHITEVIKRHANELLTRQQVQTLIENLKNTQPALVEEVFPKLFSLGEIQKVLCNLLHENIPIRDLGSILETLADFAHLTRDTDVLTEYVRQSLARTISKRFVPDNKARVITLDAALEQMFAERMRQSDQGSYVALDQNQLHSLFESLKASIEKISNLGIMPMVLTSPVIRSQFKKITEQMVPDLIVLSYNELNKDVEIYSDGTVAI